MNIAPPPASCPACDVPPVAPLRLRNGRPLRRCPRCLLGWWDWPTFDSTAFYDEAYFQSADVSKGYNDYAALEPAIRFTAKLRLRAIDRVLLTSAARGRPVLGDLSGPRRLLDVGCGTGCFLDVGRAAGWSVEGVEVSPWAADRAAQRGLRVACTPIEQVGELPRKFDVVTLWDVIEHLSDPLRALRSLAGVLEPRGLLVLSTGDITALCGRLSGARWHLFNLPEHLFFFSPLALRRLLARAGMRVVAVRREVNWFSADYLAERLLKSLLGLRGDLGSLRPWLRKITLPATLLDIVTVFAERAAPAEP